VNIPSISEPFYFYKRDWRKQSTADYSYRGIQDISIVAIRARGPALIEYALARMRVPICPKGITPAGFGTLYHYSREPYQFERKIEEEEKHAVRRSATGKPSARIVIEMNERYPQKRKGNTLPSKLNLFFSHPRSPFLGLFASEALQLCLMSLSPMYARLPGRSKRFSVG